MTQRLVSLLVLAACGPSFQTIYENDARFEHCYALDEGTTAISAKAACWKDWKEHHTYGQTRDRVEYAQSRYVALASNALPTDEGMMQAAPGEVGERSQNTAPAPTNPFAPPQAMMAAPDAGARVEQPPPPPVPVSIGTTDDAGAQFANQLANPLDRPATAPCTDDCTRLWGTCKRDRPERTCDAAYSRCVIECVKPR